MVGSQFCIFDQFYLNMIPRQWDFTNTAFIYDISRIYLYHPAVCSYSEGKVVLRLDQVELGTQSTKMVTVYTMVCTKI